MKYLAVLLVSLSLFGCASMEAVQEDQLTFSQVYEVPGYSKGQLFDGVKVWISENFRSGKSVIDHVDKEAGLIIGNGAMNYPCSGLDCVGYEGHLIYYTMRVDVKDEKFRLTFTNLESFSPMVGRNPLWAQGQFDDVKPVLLGYGEKIKSSLGNAAKAADW